LFVRILEGVSVNVFVIDDDASVRKALQRLIRSAGMTVRAFGSAEEFLEAGLPLPDCLVLDVRMPGMSGLDLLKQLTTDRQHVPVVLITAHDDEQARQAAVHAGAVDFLHKPFEDHVLLTALARAVSRNDAHALRGPCRDRRKQQPTDSPANDHIN
jgi:FixJ family two-component response regulator